MNPQDDPEARIRALEQPLNDVAQASELGTTPQYGGGAYIPPTQPYDASGGYTPVPPPMPPPAYGGQPYGGPQPYGTTYPMATGRPASSSFRWVWFLIAGIVFAIFAGIAGVVIFTVRQATDGITFTTPTPGATFSPGHGAPTIVIPSIPSFEPGSPSSPTPSTVAAGESVTVAGMGQNKTLECNNGGTVSVSGMTNTVTITGHCESVNVSGMQNKIIIDTADGITASGFDNKVTYHSGSPKINNSGGNNSVQQG